MSYSSSNQNWRFIKWVSHILVHSSTDLSQLFSTFWLRSQKKAIDDNQDFIQTAPPPLTSRSTSQRGSFEIEFTTVICHSSRWSTLECQDIHLCVVPRLNGCECPPSVSPQIVQHNIHISEIFPIDLLRMNKAATIYAADTPCLCICSLLNMELWLQPLCRWGRLWNGSWIIAEIWTRVNIEAKCRTLVTFAFVQLISIDDMMW